MFETTPRGWLRSAAAIACFVIALPAVAQQTQIKIAVVNLEAVVTASKAGIDLQDRLAKLQSEIEGELSADAKEIESLQTRIRDGAASLSEEKLTELQRDYEDRLRQLQRKREDRQREGLKVQNEGLRKIEKQLEPVIDAIQEEQGYDLILSEAGGVVIAASERVNISGQVVERFDAAYAGGTSE